MAAVDPKDIMDAVGQAAGGTTALGAGFVALGAGLLSIAGRPNAPGLLARLGIVAFLWGMTASFAATLWKLAPVVANELGVRDYLYGGAIVLLLASMGLFLIVFFWAAALLWSANVTGIMKVLGARFGNGSTRARPPD